MPTVFHLIDANADTAFFRSLARCHDCERFPLRIGSIAPPGPLQAAMHELSTPTFTLQAPSRRHYFSALKQLVKILRSTDGAILHAHCFDPALLGLFAARLARVPFVFTRHHSDHHIRLGKKWHVKVDGWTARHANRVIAVSQATRQILTEIEGVPDSKITVVYNGMEPLRQPDSNTVAKLKRQFAPRDEHILLVIARMHEEKGHRFLFEALSTIQQKVGPIIVLLAGDGPQRAEVEQQAQNFGVQNMVHFLGRRDDIPELLKASSLMVLPSLAESFGYASLEAMSLGIPVVATHVGGTPEVVADGECGLLVSPADSPALGEAIIRVLNNRDLATKLGEAGIQRAEKFSFERMVRGYEAVYAQLQNSRREESVPAVSAEVAK